MSNFSFKNMFNKIGNVKIPLPLIIAGISFLSIVIIGMISSNMNMNEQIFYEAIEKSVPFFTESELREYGSIYNELELKFTREIGLVIQDYALRTNRFGEKIHYGVYNHEHPTDDTRVIQRHNNGRQKTGEDSFETCVNDHKLSDSYIDTTEFKNGVNIKYSKTDGYEEGQSNYQDIITYVSMLLDQGQGEDGTNEDVGNIKERMPRIIEDLFYMTHDYDIDCSDLYNCDNGCRCLFYYCNEDDSNYNKTGINKTPFEVNVNDEVGYDEEEFEIKQPEGECEICGHDGKGCIVGDPCYHGSDDPEKGEHYLGRGKVEDFIDTCSKCHDEEDCEHECGTACEDGCTHTCDNRCYNCFCDGHDHWNCEGHFYVCCTGHTDITINVKIMYLQEMLGLLQ